MKVVHGKVERSIEIGRIFDVAGALLLPVDCFWSGGRVWERCCVPRFYYCSPPEIMFQ